MNEDMPARSCFNGEDAADIMPAWFVQHMMDEGGLFGLLLNNGRVLAVERIERLHRAIDGSLWLDVMLYPRPAHASERLAGLMYAPGSVQEASVNCSQVSAAFEIANGNDGSGWDGASLR